jgi:hypothetical protein
VVVAVIAVRMVQVAVDEIVDVIAMRHRFMAAPRSVNVTRVVAAAARRALVRIFRADFELVLVYVIAVRMMQMTVMQIINVIAVLDRGVSAVRAMLMVVVSVMWFVAGAHVKPPWLKRSRQLGWSNPRRVDRSDPGAPWSEAIAVPNFSAAHFLTMVGRATTRCAGKWAEELARATDWRDGRTARSAGDIAPGRDRDNPEWELRPLYFGNVSFD